jgi:His-Xaa-Ser system radical SAM maturase HxsB
LAYDSLSAALRRRRLDEDTTVAVSETGDYAFLDDGEMEALEQLPSALSAERRAELKSKFFFDTSGARGLRRLRASRAAARHETVLAGPSLHILVPTLGCGHSCRYCQVSRALDSDGFTMSQHDLEAACDAIFESPTATLTVEFQGGDPLLRFDLVRHAIERITARNRREQRTLRFVVASTLHQLDREMCAFFKAHRTYLSTSIDGPPALHNRNRPTPTRDAYERTLSGIDLARREIGEGAVAALMTTTRASLDYPEDIVDTYVALGFDEIFIRPLSHYGFARRNANALGYSTEAFETFYARAFDRVLYWNRQGVPIREVRASIALNKMLSPFDAGYVDLQCPNGAGLAGLVYNYDGYVYPSDEARMLAAAGDPSLRLGRIGEPLATLLQSDVERQLVAASAANTDCERCAYHAYCGHDPIGAYNQFGAWSVPAHVTDHCQQHLVLFDFLFRWLRTGDAWFEDLAYGWAQPPGSSTEAPHA